jgi:hypothetical protein
MKRLGGIPVLAAIIAALASIAIVSACGDETALTGPPTKPTANADSGFDMPPAENIPVEEVNRIARGKSLAEPGAPLSRAGWQLYNQVGFYGQCDPTWAGDRLGHSSLTLCSDGCVVTCMAMAYWKWGYHTFNPREVNNWGKANGAFSGPNVIWGKIGDYGRNRNVKWIQVNELYEYVRLGWPVLVETSTYGGHWFYVFGFSRSGDARFWVKDTTKNWTQQDQPMSGSFRRACVFTC